MEEVRLLYLKDDEENAVYVTEKFWDSSCEPETYYVFREDELDPQGKLYLNMLRIIKDRSLQQIDKSKADEHGYRLLRANKRKREKNWKEAWIIKKETPYSVEMDAEVAYKLIESDLFNFYHYVKKYPMSKFVNVLFGAEREEIEEYLRNRDILGKTLILDIVGIEGNYGKGVYEVTYWATNVI